MDKICSMYIRVCVRVRVNDISKTTRPRDMPVFFFSKIPYLSRMEKFSRHADLSVCLFARAITSEEPPTLSVKNLNTLSQFSHSLLQGFLSYLTHMY